MSLDDSASERTCSNMAKVTCTFAAPIAINHSIVKRNLHLAMFGFADTTERMNTSIDQGDIQKLLFDANCGSSTSPED